MFNDTDSGSIQKLQSSDEKEKSTNSNKRRLPISSSSSSSPLTKRIQQPLDTHTNQSSSENDTDQLTLEQHREFVHAIYENGLAESSPLLIWEHMSENIKAAYPELNIEKLKSKLQKYRKNKDKYEEEFMSEYDTTLNELLDTVPSKTGEERNLPSGGPDIAKLTHSILTQKDTYDSKVSSAHKLAFLSQEKTRKLLQETSIGPSTTAQRSANNDDPGSSIMTLPVLTPTERNSPIGQSFDFFLALFESFKCELYAQREHQRFSTQNHIHPFSFHDNVHRVTDDAHPDAMPSLDQRGQHTFRHSGSLTPISSDHVHITNGQQQQQQQHQQSHTSDITILDHHVQGMAALNHGNIDKEAKNNKKDRI